MENALALGCLVAVSYATWRTLRPRDEHSLRTVAILVLGDIGRSPRMMYHAQSFAQAGFVTELVGYPGSRPIPSLEREPLVRIRHIAHPPSFLASLPFILFAPIKVLYQVLQLLLYLLVCIDTPPEFIVVQNPPSIPTLALVQLVARIRGSKLIIDWHNLGYSILALKLGEHHALVSIAKRFESTFGRSAYAHLFVTRAMRDFLVKEWDLQGKKVVLYDRPPSHFHQSSIQETHQLFRKLYPSLSSQKRLLQGFLPESTLPYSTPLTHTTTSPEPRIENVPTYTEVNMPTLRSDRPAVLVSSTSWTPDEDFDVLLEALNKYESQAEQIANDATTSKGRLPKLLVIVTGKGPLRDTYMNKVAQLQETWKWVRCTSLWLEAEDYPILLGSADLGVCLHSSSSALDLPMKVVDMFGCGLPVCALDFACLDELVKDGKNGLIFHNAAELAAQLEDVFHSFPNSKRLETLRASLKTASRPATRRHIGQPEASEDGKWIWTTWEENWNFVVRPLILSDVNL